MDNSNPRPVIVTACDSNYFHLLEDLLDSLDALGLGSDVERGVVDVGLSEPERSRLISRGVSVASAKCIDLPTGLHVRPIDIAVLARPRYREIFPNGDPILHIDADAWVQSLSAIELYFKASANGSLAVTPQIDKSYLHGEGHIRWRLSRYEEYFGPQKAAQLIQQSSYNMGVFCLRRHSEIWDQYRLAFEQCLARGKHGLVSDQAVINGLIMEGSVTATPLPSYCNWMTQLATPAIDPTEDQLISPTYPHEPLGIIHLAGGTHKTVLKVPIPEVGSAEILLTRRSVMRWFLNRRDQPANFLKHRPFGTSATRRARGDKSPTLALPPGAQAMQAEIARLKTPTILLAWELGSGLGHVMRLLRLSARISRHRLRLMVAARDPIAAQMLAAHGIEVVQAPVWPSGSSSSGPQSSASMADSLGSCGFADEQTLRTLLSAWDRMLTSIEPDLVVADYAPAAALAARGRVPLILVGTGFTLPPDNMKTFPLLHQASPPIWPEATILDCVNRALKTIGSEPIERLPQIFAGNYRSVQTFALLDPYRSCRTEPADGPVVKLMPTARQSSADTIFAYLRHHRHLGPAALEALLPFAKRLRIFAPGISEGQLAGLAIRGAKIESSPPPLASVLASTCLLVHLGGANAACEAIAAGVPQLVLSVDIEKELNGRAIEQAGIGRLIKIHDSAAKLSSDLIQSMIDDDRMAVRTAGFGYQHRRQLLQSDPLGRFERECLKLIGRPLD